MIILALMTGLLFSATAAGAAPPGPDYKPVDVGPELRTWDATPARIMGGMAPFSPEEIEALEAEAAASTPYTDCILDTRMWMSLDNYTGFYFFDFFHLVAESDGAELWVQANLSWPDGDPRDPPMVTCEQAAYLVGEFDDNMYPTEIDFLWDARYA